MNNPNEEECAPSMNIITPSKPSINQESNNSKTDEPQHLPEKKKTRKRKKVGYVGPSRQIGVKRKRHRYHKQNLKAVPTSAPTTLPSNRSSLSVTNAETNNVSVDLTETEVASLLENTILPAIANENQTNAAASSVIVGTITDTHPTPSLPPLPPLLNSLNPQPQIGTVQQPKPKIKRMSAKDQEEMRTAIKVMFTRNHYETFSKCQLEGKGGIICNICDTLNYRQRGVVRRVILDVNAALDAGEEYNPAKKKYTMKKKKKKPASSTTTSKKPTNETQNLAGSATISKTPTNKTQKLASSSIPTSKTQKLATSSIPTSKTLESNAEQVFRNFN